MNKLHVVIPTFNRADKLANTLRALHPISEKHYITVFDNCSTDSTWEVCNKIGEVYGEGFHYFRRPINIGASGNILTAVISALEKGDLLWILPDDDDIDDDGLNWLSKFLDEIALEAMPDALMVGACSGRSSGMDWPVFRDTQRAVNTHQFWIHASFLPSIIFKISTLKKSVTPALFYLGGCYPQVLLLRHLLLPDAKIFSSSIRVIYRGEGETGHHAPAWWLLSWLRIIIFFPEPVRKEMRMAVAGSFWKLPLRYLVSVARVTKDQYRVGLGSNYFDLLSAFPAVERLYLFLWAPVFVLPRPIIGGLYNVYRSIFGVAENGVQQKNRI